MGIGVGKKSTETQTNYNWCEDIQQRCNQIAEVQKRFEEGKTPPQKLNDVVQSNASCGVLVSQCLEAKPLLSPQGVMDAEKKTEMGSLHDVPAFYELASALLPYLQGPQKLAGLEGPTLNVLYPASGYHVAPVELASQILQKTNYEEVSITMTEIDLDHLQILFGELKNFAHQGLSIEGEAPVLKKETPTHQEYSITLKLHLASGVSKKVTINYIIGKINASGSYPPYFKKEDFDRAHIVLVYDASSVDLMTGALDKGLSEHQGRSDKLFVTENRVQYVGWANKKGYPAINTNLSQHFGCEEQHLKQSNEGLGLKAAIFRMPLVPQTRTHVKY